MTTPDRLGAYRPNVGIVLFNADGRVWVGHRANTPSDFAWQFPQGGIDEGETPEAAALRELEEETGIGAAHVSALGQIDAWLTYDFPPEVAALKRHAKHGWVGQKQRWFAFRFNGSDSDIDLNRHGEVEFDAWRWEKLEGVPPLIISWKRVIYERVVADFVQFAS